jgi:hypothetical protein
MSRARGKRGVPVCAVVGNRGVVVAQVPERYRSNCDLGLRVEEKVKQEGLSKGGAIVAVARETGRNKSAVKYAHNVVRRLDVPQLWRLSGMRTRSGHPLSWSHVRQLGMVADPQQLTGLIEDLAGQGWTCEELCEEIRRRKGASAGRGGRKYRRPETLWEGLKQVERHCQRWLKYHDELWSRGQADWLSSSGCGDEVGAVQDRVEEVRSRLRQLARAARGLAKRLAGVKAGLVEKG